MPITYAVLSDDEPVDLPEDALVLVLHEVEVAPDVGQVPADLGHAAAHLLEDGGEGRVDVHQDLQVVRKVAPSPARNSLSSIFILLPILRHGI